MDTFLNKLNYLIDRVDLIEFRSRNNNKTVNTINNIKNIIVCCNINNSEYKAKKMITFLRKQLKNTNIYGFLFENNNFDKDVDNIFTISTAMFSDENISLINEKKMYLDNIIGLEPDLIICLDYMSITYISHFYPITKIIYCVNNFDSLNFYISNKYLL